MALSERTEKTMSKARKAGLETHRTVWIRKDVMAAVEMFQQEYKARHGTRITLKALLNEALYDLILRKKVEGEYGESVPFDKTELTPEGVTKTIYKAGENPDRLDK
jgi:hypothetical protein